MATACNGYLHQTSANVSRIAIARIVTQQHALSVLPAQDVRGAGAGLTLAMPVDASIEPRFNSSIVAILQLSAATTGRYSSSTCSWMIIRPVHNA
jgi:hypothetical protein